MVERDKALDMALGQIEKQFGKGSVMKMGDKTTMAIESVPTGALALDLALGIGGLPRGRITEIYGPESSGKTTLATHVVAEAQRNGGTCAYIDAEHAMDPVYAKAIGVDIDELLISQPDTGEQALEIADMLIRSGALDVVVIDSVAALTPRAEIEGEMGDTHVGLQARLMSQALRKLTGNLNKSKTICIFINQLREKIGVMFGSPETTPGGRALKFYSSVRLDIRRIESIKDGQEAIYYISGEDIDAVRRSPQLEGFAAKGIEVLLLTDAVDDFWIPTVGEYEGKPFKSATRAGADLDKIARNTDDSAEDKEEKPFDEGKVDALIAMFRLTLAEEVKDVRISERLTESAVCLVSDEGDMDLRIERMLKQHNQLEQSFKRILEINPRHVLVKSLAESVGKGGAGEKVEDAAWLLLDQARIIEGEQVPDPVAFSRRLNSVMASGLPS